MRLAGDRCEGVDLHVFGEDGTSRKGPEVTASSYCITFPRIAATGKPRIGGETLEVTGEAWMDHEISSSPLERDEVGRDWAFLRLLDGREIPGYVLRSKDGGVSPWA
jgi:predicted secreted hydrolase